MTLIGSNNLTASYKNLSCKIVKLIEYIGALLEKSSLGFFFKNWDFYYSLIFEVIRLKFN